MLLSCLKSFFKSYLWIPVLIFLAIYFQTVGFDFAWEDDNVVFLPQARDFDLMIKSFYSPLSGNHFFPFSFFQCYLINKIFNSVSGYHFYALILHSISCIFLGLIFFKLLHDKLISILFVLIWTFHPLNVETLTRLVCIPAHLPAGTFCLIYFYCFLISIDAENNRSRWIYTLLGSIFYLMSTTSVEQYIFFPFVSLLYYFLFKVKSFNFKLLPKSIVLFQISIILIYLLWRCFAMRGSIFYSGDEIISWTELGGLKELLFRAFWLVPQLIVHYLRLFFYPDFLSESYADWYKVGNSIFSFYSLSCQLFIILILCLAFYFRYKAPLFSFGVLWFIVSMVLVIQIIPLFSIIDEHYTYLAMIGILISIYGLFDHFKQYTNKKAFLLVALIVLSILIWRSILYIPSGKDKLSQAIYRAKYSPEWIRPLHRAFAIKHAVDMKRENEIPEDLRDENNINEFSSWINKYLNVDINLSYKYGPYQMPYNYSLYSGYSFYLYNLKMFEELKLLLGQAIEVKSDWYAYFHRIRFLRSVKEWKLAWLTLEEGIKLNPKHNTLYFDSSIIELSYFTGNQEKAEKYLKNLLLLKSKSSYPYLMLGLFYDYYKKYDLAKYYFVSAIEKDKIVSVNYPDLYVKAIELFEKLQDEENVDKTKKIIYSFNPYFEIEK